ncbi:MAG: peptidase [Steroidobacteraceae bacterium]
MTYCVAVSVDEGLVLLSDSRTNAGVDRISTFRKMTLFEAPGQCAAVIMGSGNLSVTQSVIGRLQEQLASEQHSLLRQKSMADVAFEVCEAVREVYRRDAESLRIHGLDFNPEFIVGGAVRGEPTRLFHVYAAGNFIESTDETRYFQIGETKYGKPIIDRVIHADTGVAAAAKCLLVSMDSTLRSNLTVGMPLDLAILRNGEQRITLRRTIAEDDPYWVLIRDGWGAALREVFHALPDLPLPAVAGN